VNRRTPAVLGALILLSSGLLCACGDSTGFTERTEHTCATAATSIDALARPATPADGLRYALDRYSAIELAVSTVTDSRLPTGTAGAELRARWLRPARASLGSGWSDLSALQRAVHDGQAPAAATAFTAAAQAGAVSVDTGLLSADGLPTCAALFGSPPAAPGW
jgi:hypothetical protein